MNPFVKTHQSTVSSKLYFNLGKLMLVFFFFPTFFIHNTEAQSIKTLEYDGVYFQLSKGNFLEAVEVPCLRGNLVFGKENRMASDFPKIQYSLTTEPSTAVSTFEKIILKGEDLSSSNYVIAISPIQSIGSYYIFLKGRQLYGIDGINEDVKRVYTPEMLCSSRFYRQEGFDSITSKKSFEIRMRRIPQSSVTEIEVLNRLKPGYYVLWFWARSSNVNDKLYYFTIKPAN